MKFRIWTENLNNLKYEKYMYTEIITVFKNRDLHILSKKEFEFHGKKYVKRM